MAEGYIDADVTTWVELVSRIRFGTQKAAGKSVSGARVHAVAERMARYATWKTGKNCRPGLARVAVDLEMDYRTVKAAVAVLRRVGLLLLVAEGTGRDEADDYALVIPLDLLEREDIEVWSPARHKLETERARAAVRGKYKPKAAADLRGPDGPQAGADDTEPAGASRAADAPDPGEPAGAARAAETESAGASRANLRPFWPPPPCTDLLTTDQPTDEQARTAVTGPRVREAEQPISTSGEGGGSARPPLGRAERKTAASAAQRERGETWAEQIERLRRERSVSPPPPLDVDQLVAERNRRIRTDGDALVGSLLGAT